jgi:hypothetical protein
MKLHEQRAALISATQGAEEDIDHLIAFLQSEKFQGPGDDWVRSGEVWPIQRLARLAFGTPVVGLDYVGLTCWQSPIQHNGHPGDRLGSGVMITANNSGSSGDQFQAAISGTH